MSDLARKGDDRFSHDTSYVCILMLAVRTLWNMLFCACINVISVVSHILFHDRIWSLLCLFLVYMYCKSNRKAMNRNWSNQKANPALKTKAKICETKVKLRNWRFECVNKDGESPTSSYYDIPLQGGCPL